MNNLISNFFGILQQLRNNKIDDTTKDLDYRKIKNFLRKFSSTIDDDYQLRLKLYQLFYYDIDGIPIAKLKSIDVINMDNYPYYFKNKTREEIIEIYNNEVKSKYLIKIYNQEELRDYDIKSNIFCCFTLSLSNSYNVILLSLSNCKISTILSHISYCSVLYNSLFNFIFI